MRLTRRAALASTLAAPALAQPRAQPLRLAPHADLAGFDPHWTTAEIVGTHGFMVYDTLFALDAGYVARPQLAEGAQVSADRLTWTIRLREGLRFHDNEPVRARDCVASLRRWMARDGFGQSLNAATEALEATDDRTITFRLRRPFNLLPDALAKDVPNTPFIMPERIAATPPDQQIRAWIGSGPFRFIDSEFVQGSFVAYAKNDAYLPRNEPASGMAGGKVAHFDRVEWRIILDQATAANALRANEVDWIESVAVDQRPLLARTRDVTLETLSPLGTLMVLRFNHLHPPFDRPAVRRAVLAAVNQTEYLQAVAGDPETFTLCRSFFPCGSPSSVGTGNEAMLGNLDAAKRLLAQSGYAGQRVTIIAATDNPSINAMSQVTADLLRRLGMPVEYVSADWATVVRRRANREPPERGGWNIFHTTANSGVFINPATHLAVRATGAGAWPGWPEDAALEAAITEWFAANDEAARRTAASRIEAEAFRVVPYAPLGQFRSTSAWRRSLSGVLPVGRPVAWNVQRS